LAEVQSIIAWIADRNKVNGIIGYRSWTESNKSMKQIMREQKQKYRLKGGNNG